MDIVITKSSDLKQIVNASVEAATNKVISQITSSSTSPKEWLTNREAMEFLGLSKATLQRFRATGRLPFSKIGGNIFYRYKDVVKVLEEHAVK